MSEELRIPVVEETAHVFKRSAVTHRVTVRTGVDEHAVTVREELMRGQVAVARMPMDQEVAAAPPIRTEGDTMIVPVVEERLVIEKRLFLVEELHFTREQTRATVEVPVTLRRTRVDVDRDEPASQETI